MNSRATVVSQEIRTKTPSEDIDYVADFTDILDGATINSITGNDPHGTELGVTFPSGVTEVGSAAIYGGGTVDGRTIEASKAAIFGVRGGTHDTLYEISVKVRTSDGMTREMICRVKAVS